MSPRASFVATSSFHQLVHLFPTLVWTTFFRIGSLVLALTYLNDFAFIPMTLIWLTNVAISITCRHNQGNDLGWVGAFFVDPSQENSFAVWNLEYLRDRKLINWSEITIMINCHFIQIIRVHNRHQKRHIGSKQSWSPICSMTSEVASLKPSFGKTQKKNLSFQINSSSTNNKSAN